MKTNNHLTIGDNTMNDKLTVDVAKKVLEVVDAGLCNGVGTPEPGKMCVEAAVCYALGEPHGDNPSCVGGAVRAFKIRLNDSGWSDNAARAMGMRRVAIAQLGSNKIDQKAFAEEVTLQTIRQILPLALCAVAKVIPEHAEALKICALACEGAVDLVSARAAAYAAAYAADAAAYAARAAADAARAAAYAADAARAAAYAADAAADAARAAYAARAAADAVKKERDTLLSKAAEIGVQALIKLGCLGASWLWLTKD
jgi:hypothetical protein